MTTDFANRKTAGKSLAEILTPAITPNTTVFALPRGGVPVAYEIAKKHRLPLDIFVVRKLGIPGSLETAMGAIAEGGYTYLHQDMIEQLDLPEDVLNALKQKELQEMQRRIAKYRGRRPRHPITGRDILLVDDGLATGATMRVAIMAIKQEQPNSITLAVPVSPLETLEELSKLVTKSYCLITPPHFFAVGSWYQDFDQTSDTEVITLLNSLT